MGSSHASVKQMEEDSGDVNLKRQHVDDLQRDEGDADRDDEKGDDDEDRTSCVTLGHLCMMHGYLQYEVWISIYVCVCV